MKTCHFSSVCVVGDGAWGTTLAKLLAEKGVRVTIWGAFPEQLAQIRETRENRKFLPGILLPEAILFADDLKMAVKAADCLLIATPSQYLPGVLGKLARLDLRNKFLVSVVKGIDTRSFETMSQLIKSRLGNLPLAVLSGPTIAVEVAKEIPTTAVASSRNTALMREVQRVFSTGYFRVYTNPDVYGVEICGSVKNIIAIACGICDGLGYGTNTKAALLTRGLVEMVRLGRHFGARPATFYGLTGMGDLATTCFSPNSRNRHVGESLGRGESIREILGRMNSVAEGVVTAKAVYRLASRYGIDMPITRGVYEVIYRRRSSSSAVLDLMGRALKSE